MRIETWEAELQRRRMRRAHWLGAILLGLYAALCVAVAFRGLR